MNNTGNLPMALKNSKIEAQLMQGLFGLRNIRALALTLFAASALLIITGCGSKKTDQIVLGEYGSMTGAQSTFGTSTDLGMQMAIDEADTAGGVNGVKIVKVVQDDQSLSDQARTVVTKIIDENNPTAILGEVASNNSLAAAPVCQQNKVPMVSPASTNTKVTQIGDYIFRTCFIDPFQGAVMATFATKNLKAKTAVVFYDSTSNYSKGLADAFDKTFTQQGGKLLIQPAPTYSAGAVDYKAALTAIKNANPDIIYIPGYYTEVGTIAQQARQLGITVPLLGGDGWDSKDLFASGGKALEGCYFSNHYSIDSTDSRVVAFSKAYQAKYKSGVPDAMAALGYDATNIIIAAIKAAGKPTDGDYASDAYRAKVRDAIAATKNYPGVTGNITIDADRNAQKPAVVLEIKNQAYSYVTTIGPEDTGT